MSSTIKSGVKKLIPRKLIRKIQVGLNVGTTYHCPICGYNAKALRPIGLDIPVLREKQVIGAGRRNAGCYRCGSSDRDRLIYTYLKEELQVFEKKGMQILHLAPEKNIAPILNKVGFKKYVGGDLFAEGYDYPDYVQKMNVTSIPFPDKSFDLIICNHLLEHVPDDQAAMKELYRVLKKQGMAILQVPLSKNSPTTFEDFSVTSPKDREQVFGQFDHLRIYGQDYIDRLQSVGFKVKRVNITDQYPNYGLNKNEDIIVGEK